MSNPVHVSVEWHSNRMEGGRFESVSRPYSFHQVMGGLFIPLFKRDVPALVVGDETRPMQIVTSLASNAYKLTPPGGRLRVATRLIIISACSHHSSSRSPYAERTGPRWGSVQKMGRLRCLSSQQACLTNMIDRMNRGEVGL